MRPIRPLPVLTLTPQDAVYLTTPLGIGGVQTTPAWYCGGVLDQRMHDAAGATHPVAGWFLDAFILADQNGSYEILVFFEWPSTGELLTAPVGILAGVPDIVSGLRIPAPIVLVRYSNGAVAQTAFKFSVMIRGA